MKATMRGRLDCLRNYLIDAMVALSPRGAAPQAGRKPILVVRLDAVGDFVLWLDAARALREFYPPEEYRLVLLGNALWQELAAGVTFFDAVIPVHPARLVADWRYRLDLWRRLRRGSWHAVVNPTYSRQFPLDDAVVRVCGAPQRIGSVGDQANQRGWEKRISNRWYSRLLPASDAPLMELDRNAEFMRALGAPFRSAPPELEVIAPSRPDTGEYFVVVPGASLAMKQWPVEKFAELVLRVGKRYKMRCVVCGAPGEEELGLHLSRLAAAGAGGIEVLSGKTTLLELAAILRDARLVVANDSGAVHLAAAVGTPSVCILGGAHHGRFVPYRTEQQGSRPLPVAVSHPMECYHCHLRCAFPLSEGASAPCLERIAVDEVWRQVCALLDPGSPERTSR